MASGVLPLFIFALIGLVAGMLLYVRAFLSGRRDMRQFAHRLALFGAMVFVGFTLYARIFISGEDNPYYRRFITPSQPSLVVGQSRGGEDIRPTVFNNSALDYARPLYNYSFTVGHSRYGPVYLQSIRRKLRAGTTNGLYILDVNPLAISTHRSSNDNPNQFIERTRLVANTRLVNSINPNYEFLLQNYREPFYIAALYDIVGLFTAHPAGTYRVTSTGWVRVDVSMCPEDVNQRTREKLREIEEAFQEEELSATRLRYLRRTITFLQEHGDVYLVRLPLSEAHLQRENAYMPQFDSLMTSMARDEGGHYINMSRCGGCYRFIDGEHIYYKDTQAASKQLLAAIKQIRAGNGHTSTPGHECYCWSEPQK